MEFRIVVQGPSERELRQEIEQAALREGRRRYPGRTVVVDQRSLSETARAIHKPIRDLTRKFK